MTMLRAPQSKAFSTVIAQQTSLHRTFLQSLNKFLLNFPCASSRTEPNDPVMKFSSLQFRVLSVAILCAVVPALHAQTTATTTPVGFVTVTVPAAADASTPSSSVLSIPLYAAADYVSTVATIDSTTQFSLTGAAWTASQFAVSTAPRLVRIKVSTTVPANIGRFFLVSANTTNQLTVILPSGTTNISNVLSVGDSCEIVPASTLGSVFGTTTPVVQTGTSSVADNVLIWNGSNWATYYHNGTIWKKGGVIGSTDFSGTVIYPDEGVFFIRRATSSLPLTMMGTVPSTVERSDLPVQASTLLSNRFPIDTVLSGTNGLNLQNVTGWTAGATSNTADNVFVWNGTNWKTYYYNGSIWKKTGVIGSTDQGPITTITAGSAVFITRIGAATATLSQALPYTP